MRKVVVCLFLTILMTGRTVLGFQGGRHIPRNDTTSPNVSFLSDRDRVYKNLEIYQRLSYAVHPSSYRWTGRPDQVENLRKVWKHFSFAGDTLDVLKLTQDISLPTRYEDPLNRFLIAGDQAVVESELKRESIALTMPRFGSLALADLNARTWTYSPDSTLIILNGGILNFCYEMTKIGLSTVVIDTTGIRYGQEVFDSIADNKLLLRFSKAAEDYLNDRYISTESRADTDVISENLLFYMTECMEFFCLAHEYGHIILHHNAVGTEALQFRDARPAEMPGQVIATDAHSWQQELEADLVAEQFLNNYIEYLRSKRGVSADFYPFLYHAPGMFFELSAITGDAAKIAGDQANQKQMTKADSTMLLTWALKLSIKAGIEANRVLNRKAATGIADRDTTGIGPTPVMNADQVYHPPDWIRAYILRGVVNQVHPPEKDTEGFENLSLSIMDNMKQMWRVVRPLWLKAVRQLGETPAGH